MIRLALIVLACAAAAAHAQTVLVKPYVQPGNGATLTGSDTKVLTWLTDQKPGTFTVEYGWRGTTPKTVQPERLALDFAKAKPKPKAPAKPKAADALGGKGLLAVERRRGHRSEQLGDAGDGEPGPGEVGAQGGQEVRVDAGRGGAHRGRAYAVRSRRRHAAGPGPSGARPHDVAPSQTWAGCGSCATAASGSWSPPMPMSLLLE